MCRSVQQAGFLCPAPLDTTPHNSHHRDSVANGDASLRNWAGGTNSSRLEACTEADSMLLREAMRYHISIEVTICMSADRAVRSTSFIKPSRCATNMGGSFIFHQVNSMRNKHGWLVCLLRELFGQHISPSQIDAQPPWVVVVRFLCVQCSSSK